MKATMTMRRVGSANHNSRNTTKEMDHVETNLTDQNLILVNVDGELRALTDHKDDLRKIELAEYENIFGDYIREQNRRYMQKGKKDKIKSLAEYYDNSRNAKPIEMILQIGAYNEFDKDDIENRRAFLNAINEYVSQLKEHYPQMHILSIALHTDETSLHAHVRYVLWAEKDNIRTPLMDKALEQMGVNLYNPNKQMGRFNNRLMRFTEDLRSAWYDVVERFTDIRIDREPDKKRRKQHLEKADFEWQSAMKKIEINNRILEKQMEALHIMEKIDEVEEGIEHGRGMAKKRQKQHQIGR